MKGACACSFLSPTPGLRRPLVLHEMLEINKVHVSVRGVLLNRAFIIKIIKVIMIGVGADDAETDIFLCSRFEQKDALAMDWEFQLGCEDSF